MGSLHENEGYGACWSFLLSLLFPNCVGRFVDVILHCFPGFLYLLLNYLLLVELSVFGWFLYHNFDFSTPIIAFTSALLFRSFSTLGPVQLWFLSLFFIFSPIGIIGHVMMRHAFSKITTLSSLVISSSWVRSLGTLLDCLRSLVSSVFGGSHKIFISSNLHIYINLYF